MKKNQKVDLLDQNRIKEFSRAMASNEYVKKQLDLFKGVLVPPKYKNELDSIIFRLKKQTEKIESFIIKDYQNDPELRFKLRKTNIELLNELTELVKKIKK